jgi:hypothetical protein
MLRDEYTVLADCRSSFRMVVWVYRLLVVLMILCCFCCEIMVVRSCFFAKVYVSAGYSTEVLMCTKQQYNNYYTVVYSKTTHPSSSTPISFKSRIKSNLNAIRRACCELISYRSIIPFASVAAINF